MSPLGFRSLVPHLAGITPPSEHGQQVFVAEIAIIVDDAELIPIRKMPMRNGRERTERTQATDALVGTVAACANLLQQLPGPSSMSLYIWNEFDASGRDPSTVVVEKLSRSFDKSEHVRILNQFPQEEDGSLSAQTISVRQQWQLNLRDYRSLATSGPRLDLASGLTALALGMMCRAILGGAISRLAARREANLELRGFDVPITAVIVGDGRVLTNEEKRHTAHHHLIPNEPDADFIAARHQHHTMDWHAQGVLNVGIAHRPPVGVLRGYVTTKPETTKELETVLLTKDAPVTLADFGRSPFSIALATTTGLAAAVTRMQEMPRLNFSLLFEEVTSQFQVPPEDRPRFRLGLSQTASAVVNRAYYFAAALADRPDVFFDKLAMFANDHEKIASRGAQETFQRRISGTLGGTRKGTPQH